MNLKESFHTGFYSAYHKTSILMFLILTIVPNIFLFLTGANIDLIPVKMVVISIFVVIYFLILRFKSVGVNIAGHVNVVLMFIISTWLSFSTVVAMDYPSEASIFLISISVLYCTFSLSSMRVYITYSIYSMLAIAFGFYVKYDFEILKALPFAIILSVFLFLTGILLRIRISISDSMYKTVTENERQALQLSEYNAKVVYSENLMSSIFTYSPYQLAVLDVNTFKYTKANIHCFPGKELMNYMQDKNDFDYCRDQRLDMEIAKLRTASIERAIAKKETDTMVEKITFANDETSMYERTHTPILNADGVVINILMTSQDITEDVKIKANLEKKDLDPVSNTFTRKYFESFIKKKVRLGELFIVGVVHIDNLKLINDKFGYDYGDRFFRLIGDFLKGFFDPTDCVGRLAGNEFIVCVDRLQTVDEINYKFAKMQAQFNTVVKPFGLEESLRMSVGVSIHTLHGNTYSFLLKYADEALEKARSLGVSLHIYGA